MKLRTTILASALALMGTAAFAQTGTIKSPSSEGAPTSAAVDSRGNTNPGAVKNGTSAGGTASMSGHVGTTAWAMVTWPNLASAPANRAVLTSASVNSHGDATSPGAVKHGKDMR